MGMCWLCPRQSHNGRTVSLIIAEIQKLPTYLKNYIYALILGWYLYLYMFIKNK